MESSLKILVILSVVFTASCNSSNEKSKKPDPGTIIDEPTPTPTANPSATGTPIVSPTAVPTQLGATGACPKYPVVFHHGFMGNKSMGSFRNAKIHFEKKGCKIFETEVAAVQ